MQYTEHTQWRSKEAQALAEKVHAQTAKETLDVKLKVHLDLGKRDPKMLRELISCLQGKRNFILYSDANNYTIFMPNFRQAVCFMDGQEYSDDISLSDERYHERVKLAMMGYDRFFEPATVIQDGQTTPLLQLQ